MSTTLEEEATVGRIVVGVDGSGHAENALHWAITEAEQRGSTVDAVAVHASPAWIYAMPMEAVVYTGISGDDLDKATRELLHTTVERVLGARKVEVAEIVAEGSPGQVLKDCAKGADLLVIGTHGYGAVRGSLVGSVTLKVLHDPPCPVVAVPFHEAAE